MKKKSSLLWFVQNTRQNFIRRVSIVIIAKKKKKSPSVRETTVPRYETSREREREREALFAREKLIHARSSSRRQTNGIEQFVFARRLSSGYYLARVSRVSRIKSADGEKRRKEVYTKTRKLPEEWERERGNVTTTVTTIVREKTPAGGEGKAARRRGDKINYFVKQQAVLC